MLDGKLELGYTGPFIHLYFLLLDRIYISWVVLHQQHDDGDQCEHIQQDEGHHAFITLKGLQEVGDRLLSPFEVGFGVFDFVVDPVQLLYLSV